MTKKPAKPTKRAYSTASQRTKKGEPRKGKGGPTAPSDRIAKVEELIVLQFSSREIARRISKDFLVSERTAYDDIRRVYADLKAASDDERDGRRDAALRTAQMMFRRAVAAGDMKTADRFFDKVCRIAGAYAPDALKVLGGDIATIASLTDEQLNAEIVDELKKTVAALPPERRAALLARAAKESE